MITPKKFISPTSKLENDGGFLKPLVVIIPLLSMIKATMTLVKIFNLQGTFYHINLW